MLVQIGLLGKLLVALDAVLEGAGERLLLRVDPCVVVEVVPLAEVELAACEVTLDQLQEALRFWVSELKDSELSELWDRVVGVLVVDFVVGEVISDVGAMNNFNLGAFFRDLVADHLDVDAVSFYIF
jgi:hypothetical protein